MEKQRKIIIVSLAASLMAVILYVFGITLAKGNIIIEALYLVMASLLVVSVSYTHLTLPTTERV